MENNIEKLKKDTVFKYFFDICSIPHGSGNLDGIINYLISFAKEKNLRYIVDDAKNVIIYKDRACIDELKSDHISKNFESELNRRNEHCEPVILQAHIDMVAVKTSDSKKDLSKDKVEPYVDGNYLKAVDSSLGADDGIGVAMILALLSEEDANLPSLEALFTSDEETGMNGALGVDGKNFKGNKLINIDSENEGVLTVSCCGGSHIDSKLNINRANVEVLDNDTVCINKNTNDVNNNCGEVKGKYKCFKLILGGLLGGHSGMEIHRGRANAIIEMAYILKELSDAEIDYYLIAIDGGKFENVICPEATSYIYVNMDDITKFNTLIDNIGKELKEEYVLTDENIFLTSKQILHIDDELKCMMAIEKNGTMNLIDTLIALPNGLIEISQEFTNLPWTSLNHGVIETSDDAISLITFIRSNDDIKRKKLVKKYKLIMKKFGFQVDVSGEYPAWRYNKKSKLKEIMLNMYHDLYGKDMIVEATHGGLECGLLMEKIKDLDAVSIGPTIEGVHSVDEKLYIDTVYKVYDFLKKTLKEL